MPRGMGGATGDTGRSAGDGPGKLPGPWISSAGSRPGLLPSFFFPAATRVNPHGAPAPGLVYPVTGGGRLVPKGGRPAPQWRSLGLTLRLALECTPVPAAQGPNDLPLHRIVRRARGMLIVETTRESRRLGVLRTFPRTLPCGRLPPRRGSRMVKDLCP